MKFKKKDVLKTISIVVSMKSLFILLQKLDIHANEIFEIKSCKWELLHQFDILEKNSFAEVNDSKSAKTKENNEMQSRNIKE